MRPPLSVLHIHEWSRIALPQILTVSIEIGRSSDLPLAQSGIQVPQL